MKSHDPLDFYRMVIFPEVAGLMFFSSLELAYFQNIKSGNTAEIKVFFSDKF